MTIYKSQTPTASVDLPKPTFWQRLWSVGGTNDQTAKRYALIVARARRAEDYTGFDLLDTADNRREWLGCWAALAMIRLHRLDHARGPRQAQALFDHAFADLEENFRERGVADQSIPRHVKQAAATFLARYRVIEQALDSGQLAELAATLERHMAFGAKADAGQTEPAAPGAGATAMAKELLASYARLALSPEQDVLNGRLDWDPSDTTAG